MTFAQGSRNGLSYIVEATFGTTPGTPSMLSLPINTHSIELAKTTIESAEIRSDRQTSVSRHGNKRVQGDIEVDFRADDHDDFLEAACFGAFDSFNELRVGITPKFMTIEDRQLDIGYYRQYRGCAVNTMAMTVKPDEIVKATFGIVGKSSTAGAVSLDASPTADGQNDPFDAFSGTLNEGGSPVTVVSGIEFQLENGVDPAFVVGSSETPQLQYGRAKITGQVTVFYEDLTLVEKFINETASSLSFAMSDGATTYTFTFPNIKYNGASMPLQNEQSRIITMPFVALYDAVEGTNLVIAKS